jgi:hypothetical protein
MDISVCGTTCMILLLVAPSWRENIVGKIPIHIYVVAADCSRLRPIAEVVKLISVGVRTSAHYQVIQVM